MRNEFRTVHRRKECWIYSKFLDVFDKRDVVHVVNFLTLESGHYTYENDGDMIKIKFVFEVMCKFQFMMM